MHVVAYLAHADDEVLGCGGLLAKFSTLNHDVTVVIASDAVIGRSDKKNIKSYAYKAAEVLGVRKLIFLDFKDQYFDDYPLIEFNRSFEKLQLNPDLLITHAPYDVNKDHQVIFRSALVVTRPILKQINVLGCEILGATEWGPVAFSPTLYVDISDFLKKKLEAMKMYSTELRKFPHPRSLEGIQIKAKQRGMEMGCQAAEAYQVIRWFAFKSLT